MELNVAEINFIKYNTHWKKMAPMVEIKVKSTSFLAFFSYAVWMHFWTHYPPPCWALSFDPDSYYIIRKHLYSDTGAESEYAYFSMYFLCTLVVKKQCVKKYCVQIHKIDKTADKKSLGNLLLLAIFWSAHPMNTLIWEWERNFE